MIDYSGLDQNIDGSVSRGWRRWERARRNAIASPTSHGAKLFKQRVVRARELSRFTSLGTGVEIVWKSSYRTDKLRVCSAFCASMALELELHDWKDMSLVDRQNVLMGKPVTGTWSNLEVTERTNTRKVQCFVCGVEMTKSSIVHGTAKIDFGSTHVDRASVRYTPLPEASAPVVEDKVRVAIINGFVWPLEVLENTALTIDREKLDVLTGLQQIGLTHDQLVQAANLL